MHDVDQALLVCFVCSQGMPASVAALWAMRKLLGKAILLLQEVIVLIDKSLASDKSTQVFEIRHYCVWAFPPNAPGKRGPGIYSGEHPEVYNTILAEAGLKQITGALQLKKYESVFQCQGRWLVDMPPPLSHRGTLPPEPAVFEFYSSGDPSGV